MSPKDRRRKRLYSRLGELWKNLTPHTKSRTGKGKRKNSRPGSKVSRELNPDQKIFFTILLVVVSGLIIFGLPMVYSGSFYVASNRASTLFFPGNPFHFFILQTIWVIAGSILGYIVYQVPTQYIKKLIPIAFIVVLVLLVFVLTQPGDINGAKRWIQLTTIGINIPGVNIQPSEFAKPIIIVYLAAVLSRPWKAAKEIERTIENYISARLLPFLLIAAPVIGLVVIGRDLATAIIVALISLGIYIFSDDSIAHNISIIVVGVVGTIIAAVFVLLEPFRMNRLSTYISFIRDGEIVNPLSTGYQLNQILIAVGSGGLFGYGYGQSRQKYFYLQETAFSDTIFAVIAEEFGLFGAATLVIAFFVLFAVGIAIATHAKTKFAALLAIGITIWLTSQSIIHLAVNVGLLPVTGVPLPFLSYGGSSMVSCIVGVALLLNICREGKLGYENN